jgi:crotonobetainyl-CoA:carnitine CoA-transferase CaiB-like acyl-CoA transferase
MTSSPRTTVGRRVAHLAGHLCSGAPLEGIQVIDVTQQVAGPMATQYLGDQGADIVKVEPLTGSPERGSGVAGSSTHNTVNRNKRSLALNLKERAGVKILLRLAKNADVFIQNFRPGVVDRMGIGYEDVKAVNPGIIYVSSSGFGQTGPYAKKRVYDPIVQAVSGLMSVQADENGRPRMLRVILPDKVTALTSAQAISSALVKKMRTGEGCHIQVAMVDAVVSFVWCSNFSEYANPGTNPNPQTEAHYVRDMVFKASDGYITCGANQDKVC